MPATRRSRPHTTSVASPDARGARSLGGRTSRTPPALSVCAAAVGLALGQMGSTSVAADCTLSVSGGAWATGANWSCGARPVAADSATINAGSSVTVGGVEQIGRLTNAGQVSVNAFGNLSIVGGVAGTSTNAAGGVINVGTATSFLRLSTSLVNDGTINLNAVNAFSSDLQISGNQTISGSGTINGTFDAVSPTLTGNRIVGVGVGDTLTLGTGQTVSGRLNIGYSATLTDS